MRSFVERELKLDLGEGFTLPELPGEPLESRLFTSTYHDTPDRSLAGAGLTLRRRVENGLSRWQLKLPRGGNARAELEAPGGPAGPPAALADLLVAHLRHGRLEPVATLRTRRAGVRVADDGRTIADVTLDSVAVLDAGRSAGGFAEIEIELVDGDDGDLERLGRRLRKAGAKTSDGMPKLLRVLPPPPRLQALKDATAVELLHVLLADQLRELLRFDPGVRLGDDPEDVHRYRVATRRSRALIRATKPVLGDRLASLAGELKWLAGLLGPVRDRDVLIERLRGEVRTLDRDRAAGETLVALLEDERERLRDRLLDALRSERYFELLDAFAAAVAALPEVSSDREAREIAAAELRELRRAAKQLAPVPADAELHALRITAKHARYGAELVAAGRANKQLRRYLAALKELQDVVGEHQDAVVAEARLRKLASPPTALAAGRLIEVRAAPASRAAPALSGSAGDRARPRAESAPLMPLLLVRHASAGDRAMWEGDDRERPLDVRGRRAADDLIERLAPFAIEQILTSPYRRCVETVAPLARARGFELDVREELGEERQGTDGIALVRSLAGSDVVVCGHGGLDAVVPAAPSWKKGAVFVLGPGLELLEIR